MREKEGLKGVEGKKGNQHQGRKRTLERRKWEVKGRNDKTSEKLFDLSFNILICKSVFSLQKRGCPLFAGPGVVASWENLMCGLKLLDAF